ncbi:MAG: thioredoxin family protein [Planctomycetota bacterium]|nr:thioredoxin family protein [Planctomycetota bacterium]
MTRLHRLRRSSSICILAAAFVLAGVSAAAAEQPVVEWSVRPASVTAARGQAIKVEVVAAIPDGWHIYSTKHYGANGPAVFPTAISVGSGSVVKVAGEITYPKPTLIKQDAFDVEMFEKSATFAVPLQVNADAKPGDYKVALTVDSQICSDTACVPSFGKTVSFALRVTEEQAGAAPAAAVSAPAFGTRDEIERARQSGLLAYLVLALSMGAAALLTPCVFPMIPITVSFFTKRKETSRARSIRDAAVYALGIVLTFIGLGFLFTLLMGATGIRDFAANPWVNLFIAAVFVVFALNLLGSFEIQLPGFILERLSSASRPGQGIGAVLLMGLVFSLTSFTCTVPFIGAALFSATQGQWLWPLVGMFGFATAFSAPFFVLALFPPLLKALPKSGGWLNSVKVVMGFLELAAAMKFLSQSDLAWRWGFLTREVFVSVWIALAVLTAFYLLGRIQFPHDTPLPHIGAVRALFATAFLSLGFWLTTGLFGQPLGELDAYVPPKPYPGQEVTPSGTGPAAGAGLTWLEDWDSALAEAQRSGKPLFVDFTGYTCTNCRWMETNMFSQPEVSQLLTGFVRVQLHADGRKDAHEIARSLRNRKIQEERFKTVALPFYAIISPDDKVLATFPGLTRDVGTFVAFLKTGK